ncbi:unnamed protein product [Fusarium graminearum]|uniref:Chromosome 1, complete genome n=1 Tax=Gibberella zeae (strain ATCC MYA-4620 / CBS 123657 / FGSC 9075 / NRRL 31084 / PH-1) TaxID=229533 RepID=A0A098D3A6_GIBZE|nr:unnamed protein product [Fusarium graminearum]CZS76184.1 unnamed protein product [Fusarium graminearum]
MWQSAALLIYSTLRTLASLPLTKPIELIASSCSIGKNQDPLLWALKTPLHNQAGILTTDAQRSVEIAHLLNNMKYPPA